MMHNGNATTSVGRKRVIAFKNGTITDGKVIILTGTTKSWENLITAATETFGISVKRIFAARGKEINNVESIRNGQRLFVSAGEPFIRINPKKHSAQNLSVHARGLVLMCKELQSFEKKFYTLLKEKLNKCNKMLEANETKGNYLGKRIKIFLQLGDLRFGKNKRISKTSIMSNQKKAVAKMKRRASRLEKCFNFSHRYYREFLKRHRFDNGFVKDLLTCAKAGKNMLDDRPFAVL